MEEIQPIRRVKYLGSYTNGNITYIVDEYLVEVGGIERTGYMVQEHIPVQNKILGMVSYSEIIGNISYTLEKPVITFPAKGKEE